MGTTCLNKEVPFYYSKHINKHVDLEDFISYFNLGSAMILMLTGGFLFINKRFNKHPYKLLAATCLVEAAFYNLTANQSIMCSTNMSELFSISVYTGSWNEFGIKKIYGYF